MVVAPSLSPICLEAGQGNIRALQRNRTREPLKPRQKGFENTRDLKLSVEVTLTRGDASKLERYLALGRDEVWFWETDALVVAIRP